MSKLSFVMLLNVLFRSLPVTTVVTNFIASGTDRNQTGQRLDLRHGFLQLFNQHFPFFLSLDVDLVLVFPKMYTEIIKIYNFHLMIGRGGNNGFRTGADNG